MIEIGGANYTDRINDIITSIDSMENTDQKLIEIIRNISYYPLWDKYNLYKLLHSLYRINLNIEPEQKIKISMLDVPFSWNDSTINSHSEYWEFFYRVIPDRDSIMGQHAIDYMQITRHNKALIILNSPHSYQRYENKYNRQFAAEYIFQAFPDRVANVMINWCLLSPSDKDKRDELIAKGVWDAAFSVYGYKSIGFDFADSPFGNDEFYDMSKPLRAIRYKDVYTGFIYYKPPYEWVGSFGTPGIMDEEFRTNTKEEDKFSNQNQN